MQMKDILVQYNKLRALERKAYLICNVDERTKTVRKIRQEIHNLLMTIPAKEIDYRWIIVGMFYTPFMPVFYYKKLVFVITLDRLWIGDLNWKGQVELYDTNP